MPIEVEGPKGVERFPDGTPDEEINRQMSQKYGFGDKLGTLAAHPGLPKGGDQSPAQGNVMPSMQTIPNYRSPEDWMNIGLATVMPRGAASVIQNTPGHAMRMEYAKKIGDDAAASEIGQKAGLKVLSGLQVLKQTADNADDSTLHRAIGPHTSSSWFQKTRRAAMMPLDLVMDPKNVPFDPSYNLNNVLHHDIEGMVTEFMAAGKAVNMSDARQAAFKETMGAMMNATSRQEFNRIVKHAAGIIRDTFQLPEEASPPMRGTEGAPPPPAGTAAPAAPIRKQFQNQATGQYENFELVNGQWKKVP